MQCLKHLPTGVKWTLRKHRTPSTVVCRSTGASARSSARFQPRQLPSTKQLVVSTLRTVICGRPGFLQLSQCLLFQCKALSNTSTPADPIEQHRKRLRGWFSHMPNEEKQFGSFSMENWHVDPVIAVSSPEENREFMARFGVYSHIEPLKSQVIKVDKVFTTESDETRTKNVVLFGTVGMGKSTVVKKLVLDWCDGRLNQFDIILPFSCEDLSSQNQPISLNKLITRKYTQLKPIVSQIGSGKQSNILFIFAGLEQVKLDFHLSKTELCSDPNEPLPPNGLLVNLLRRYLLPDATILVTTRPSALDSIPTKYVDRYTRICGFTDVEQQYLYFRNRLDVSGNDNTNEDLMKMLYKNLQRQSQLTAACFLPSYCWLICATLHFLHFTTANMPIQTLTGLYTSFLRLNFGGEIIGAHSQQNISIVRYIAKTVGKVAYEGIEKKKTLFSEEDLQRCFGLDTKTEEELNQLTAFQIDMLGFFMSPSARHNSDPLLRFTIPAMQEYLAALYVVLGERKSVLERVGSAVSDTIGKASEDVTAVLSIVSRLLPFRILTFVRLVNIFPRIFQRISNKSKKGIANTMVFEMFKQDDEFNNDVLEQINSSILGKEMEGCSTAISKRMESECFELFPTFMAGLLARENRLLLDQLGCTIKNITVREIANNLKKHLSNICKKQLPPSELLDLLFFLYEMQNDAFAGTISRTFKSLNLSQVKMTSLKCFVIASVMNTSSQPVEEMNFSLCNLSEDCLKILQPVLLRCKDLNLQFNNFRLGAWREISSLLLDPNCAVEKLWLSDNPLSEAAVKCIGPAIAHSQSVSQLSLLNTSLGANGVRMLTPYIRENTHLKEINLASNLINDDAAIALVEMAQGHPTLEKIHLYLNEISDSGKQKLQALERDQDGVTVLVSITEGSNVSAHWTLILENIAQNAVNGDKERVANYLTLFQDELNASRQQTGNFWKKMKLLQVQNGVENLLKQIKQEKK
ncbi:NLR family member X1 [Heptranchias perlo]|uniref:NLR family member X1 n=1 Tax=Heptranchias perlo TaxID=212740 RepID=UPI003559F6E8